MRRPLVIANWKMHTNFSDAIILSTAIRDGLENVHGIEVVLCPPSIWIPEVAQIIKHDLDHLTVGAQNIHYLDQGDVTGEISAPMLKKIAKYVIVGHSERRASFGEDNKVISRKVVSALEASLTPIICVGEKTKSHNDASQVVQELRECLANVNKDEYNNVVVAYEPVWAIGADEPAAPEHTIKIINNLREVVDFSTPILYGGSVDIDNVYNFIKHPEIDGILVGRAGLKAKEFIKICRIVAEYKKII